MHPIYFYRIGVVEKVCRQPAALLSICGITARQRGKRAAMRPRDRDFRDTLDGERLKKTSPSDGPRGDMVKGFPGIAGDITAFVGWALWPAWAAARLLMHILARFGGIRR